MADITILLGFHDKATLMSYGGLCFAYGYEADEVASVDGMLERIGQGHYTRYLMDLNLGKMNSPDITSARMVYNSIRAQLDSQQAKFLGLSANKQAVENAQREGIPAMNKNDFTPYKLKEFLKSIK
ncbi:hypothetical protein HYV80_00970 [Candidatus Woesearchaeota archaeon]|nr:hypothetical protein [Candidatus Woesearchaeota archaeon]